MYIYIYILHITNTTHQICNLCPSPHQVDSRDPHGSTALLRAVQLGLSARPTIQRLLEARAEVAVANDARCPWRGSAWDP